MRCDALTYRDLCIDLGQRRKMWDPVFSEGKVVELVDECTAVIWMELRSKKCVIEVNEEQKACSSVLTPGLFGRCIETCCTCSTAED